MDHNDDGGELEAFEEAFESDSSAATRSSSRSSASHEAAAAMMSDADQAAYDGRYIQVVYVKLESGAITYVRRTSAFQVLGLSLKLLHPR